MTAQAERKTDDRSRWLRCLGRLASTALVALAGLFLPGCGGDSGTPPPSGDLERMAGSWQGIEFRLTSQQAPIRTFELIDAGGTFRLDIQASGRYAATLTLDIALWSA